MSNVNLSLDNKWDIIKDSTLSELGNNFIIDNGKVNTTNNIDKSDSRYANLLTDLNYN